MTPYSILAGENAKEEWEAQKANLETLMGSRTTRAHIMKQIHLQNFTQDFANKVADLLVLLNNKEQEDIQIMYHSLTKLTLSGTDGLNML